MAPGTKEFGLRRSFSMVCTCGHRGLILHGHRRPSAKMNRPRFTGPFQVECPFCGKSHFLFDPILDGYAAELGNAGLEEPEEPEVAWHCPRCLNREGRVTVVFGYGYELEEADAEYDPDYFDVIAIHHACARCSRTTRVAVEYCA